MNVSLGYTTTSRNAEDIVRAACSSSHARPDCVVACGGDGTVQQIANAIAPIHESGGSEAPLVGIAPAGRCNDFARALGISADPIVIAGAVAGGVACPVDLGRAGGRYFCTVATLGVDAEVSSYVDSMRVPLRGTAAYLYGAVRVLARYRPHQVHLVGDFGEIRQAVFLASTANTPSYGGAIRIVPGADPTDGMLDLCVIDAVSRLRSFALLPRVLAGRHESHRGVRFIRTTRFTVDAFERMQLWADGERIAQTPVEIEAARGAIRVLLPRTSPLASRSNAAPIEQWHTENSG